MHWRSGPDIHRSGILMVFGHLTRSNGCPWYLDSRTWPFVRSRHSAICMTCPSNHSSSSLREFQEQLHTFCPPALPHLYIFIFTPGLCRLGIGNYLALGHEYAYRGLYLHAALVLEQPNHDLLHLGSLTMLVIW